MRSRSRYVWTIAVVGLSGNIYQCHAATTPAKPSASTTSQSTPATCGTATINYITHSLPQQCLWTTRSTSAAAPSESTAAPGGGDTNGLLATNRDSTIPEGVAAHNDLQPYGPSTSHVSAAADNTRTVSHDGASTTSLLTSVESAIDTESPLDDAKFLSFEDWMRQNLGATGQSAEAMARAKGQTGTTHDRQRPGNTLDTLGEDSEISLDFGGFGVGESAQARQNSRPAAQSHGDSGSTVPASGPSGARSRDAGKTCKERFNYASFDCAANILKTNPKCKSSSSVLVENKDSYMLNECAMDNKFLIVELCDHIQIDTVVLANFEFFSSMFRTFRISVSDRYPVRIDKWKMLGTYEARNTREIQAFLVENPLIWARYLRVEFLTHYGNEFYCPLSLLRVHGTTMMEDYRHLEAMARGEIDAGDDEEDAVMIPTPVASNHAGAPDAIMTTIDVKVASPTDSTTETIRATSSSEDLTPLADQSAGPLATKETSSGSIAATCPNVATLPAVSGTGNPSSMCPPSPITAVSSNTTSSTVTSRIEYGDAGAPSPRTSCLIAPGSDLLVSTGVSITAQSIQTSTEKAPLSPATSLPITTKTTSVTKSLTISTTGHSVDVNNATDTQSKNGTQSQPSTTQTPPGSFVRASNSSSAATPIAQPSQPATQESFFKTLSKRLTSLESNASLSLQYIESQSSLLRNAFAATSANQLNKTATFLAHLNSTVLKELTAARKDYDQLWQSTVLELAGQRDEGRREREVLSERVRLLAEEVVGTKRLMAAQAALLLLVLGVVVFSRAAPVIHGDSNGGSVDLRLHSSVQGLVQRSRSGVRRSASKTPLSNTADNTRLAPGVATDDDRETSTRRRWHWENVSPWASPGVSRPHTRPGTSHSAGSSAAGEPHGLGHDGFEPRDFASASSETIPHPQMQPRSPFLLDKPLPLEPLDGAASPRPESPHDDNGEMAHHDPPSVHKRPQPLPLVDRRRTVLQGTRSAPATPRAGSPPPPQNVGSLPLPDGSDVGEDGEDVVEEEGFADAEEGDVGECDDEIGRERGTGLWIGRAGVDLRDAG